jgi:hypothetical protein
MEAMKKAAWSEPRQELEAVSIALYEDYPQYLATTEGIELKRSVSFRNVIPGERWRIASLELKTQLGGNRSRQADGSS